MKLSVLMITYNHEAYIAQALNSVLEQEVNFQYEIVIGDDCSTDQTKDILLEFKNKYPEKIKLILHQKNVGMHINLEKVFDACMGEYIAVLEGDDYWINEDKLQKQVDFMDADKEVSECFHKVNTVYQDMQKGAHEFPEGLTQSFFTLKDVISQFFIPTLSIMFRRSSINKFPTILHQMTNPDWLIHVLCAEKGKIGFINEVMGVYRVHSGGIWSGEKRVKVLENTIQSAYIINKYLNYQYDWILTRRIAGWYYEAGEISIREFSFIQAIRYCSKFVCIRMRLLFSKSISRENNE